MSREARRVRLDARLAYATTAVGISAVSLIAPVLPELAEIYAVSVSEVAAIQVAVLVPGIVSARWLLGRGADRGLHRMLGWALLGYGTTGALLLWLSHFGAVLGVRAVQGFFCGGLVAGAFALLSNGDADSQSRIARNAALICVMMAIQPVVGSALSVLGPRGPFAFYLASIPLGVLMLTASSRRGGHVAGGDEDVDRSPPRATMGEALTTTAVINALLFGWLLYFGPVHLSTEYGMGVSGRGLVLSSQAVLGALLALSITGLLRRQRERRLLYVGLIVPLTGLTLVVLAPTLSLAVVGFLLVGATYGAANPAVISLLAQRGRRATGAWQSSARIGQVLGPALAGWLVGQTVASQVLLAGIGLGVVGLCRLIVGDVLRSRRPRSGESSPARIELDQQRS